MVHTIMIVLHAAAAVLCFTFGVMTLLPHVTNPARRHSVKTEAAHAG